MSPYHHGDLRSKILAEAALAVAQRGADGISLRELARAAGVSHAAPAHHFGDRRGLFTALAADGFTRLAAALKDTHPRFVDAALAYVRFALAHPGHYAVMFDTALLDADDPQLRGAQAAAGAELARGVRSLGDAKAQSDPGTAELAAWSLVHGFSTLWLHGAVTDEDPMAAAERIARMLFDG